MSKMQVGFAGWRGMVGSVLLQRMREEGDFDSVNPVFLSTSQAGEPGPEINGAKTVLEDAYDIEVLKSLDIIVTCQGSDYTKEIHPKLRTGGWDGYWIDASSELRREPSSVLVLDPVNRDVIDGAIAAGKKDLIGANCTVSTMLMGLSGLFKSGLVEYANPSTYQAVSGAGAKNMIELIKQSYALGEATKQLVADPAKTILDIDKKAADFLRSNELPKTEFGYPIAGNVLPWIDSAMDNGQSREEHKAQFETNSILGLPSGEIVIDGTCVRVGSMRSHAQNLTLKLKKDVPLGELEEMISSAHEWVKLVPNTKEETLKYLTPVATSGSLDVAVGRLRKLDFGPQYVNAFVVGDQLLWGAAEPLRRTLKIINT